MSRKILELGDRVEVLSGQYKGKTGRVWQIDEEAIGRRGDADVLVNFDEEIEDGHIAAGVELNGEKIREGHGLWMPADFLRSIKKSSVMAEGQEPKKKSKVEMIIRRKGGKTFFEFSIAPELEALYRNMEGEVRDSTAWQGLRFYFVPSIVNLEEYKRRLAEFDLFDDYGAELLRQERGGSGVKFNIAWLRTEGGRGSVQVKNAVNFARLSVLMENCLRFLKEYHDDFFRDFKIRGSLTIDL